MRSHVGLSLRLLLLTSAMGDPVLQPPQCFAGCCCSAQTTSPPLASGWACSAPHSTAAAVLYGLRSCRLHVPAVSKQPRPADVHLTHQPDPWQPVHPCRPKVGAA